MSIGYASVDSVVLEPGEIEEVSIIPKDVLVSVNEEDEGICPWYGIVKNSKKKDAFIQNHICNSCDGKGKYQHPKYGSLRCPIYCGNLK